jgi:hypothetical protein
MSRHALNGIGQVIKANTTEKSIDDLRAEGKKRVRVVSGERVMSIIQAIVDDAINSEVGAITARDRDRLVTDTQERFSRVLKMQQDLEQDVEDLRASLRAVEVERDRLKVEKATVEAQLDAARRADGESDAVSRLAREVARVRDAVERASREAGGVDEAALERMAETLAPRDAQASRRVGAEFEDIRSRLDVVSRDAAAARDAAAEKALARAREQRSKADTELADRMDREFRELAKHLADVREELVRRPGDDEIANLRADLDAMAARIGGVERSSADMAERVAKAVHERLGARDATTNAAVSEAVERLAARTTEVQTSLAAGFDGAVSELRAEFMALTARNVDAAERQDQAVRELSERIAQHSAGQADALQSNFKGALDKALDQITRTMQSATARPIETTSEATEVLLSKIFDVPDGEMTSNLDQIEIEQVRAKGGIASSVGRLKAMGGRGKPEAKQST